MLSDFPRTLRTVRHLRPGQWTSRLRHELWLRTLKRIAPLQRRLYAADPSAQAAQVALSPPDGRMLEQLRETAERFRLGRVLLFGEEADRDDFTGASQPKLWRYQRHYQDELSALATVAAHEPEGPWLDEARSFLQRWEAAVPPGAGDAWEPYPVARRILSWAEACAFAPGLRPALAPLLLGHLRFLRRHVERHLLGNHLLCDAAALVAGGCALEGAEAARIAAQGAKLLAHELKRQLLPDGGYAERAPLYHALVLRDALLALALARQRHLPLPIENLVSRMLRFLTLVRRQGGLLPCLNDSTVEASFIARDALSRGLMLELLDASDDHSDDLSLPDTGWSLVRHGRSELLFEHGPLGPAENPGHGHADALSFELFWDGAAVILDTGVSTYAPGPERDYERSARAHACVTVDGESADELWGAFRAGGRAHVSAERAGVERGVRLLRGRLRAFQGWTHERRIAFLPGRALVVLDEVRDARGRIEAHLPLAPSWFLSSGVLQGPRPLELRVLRGTLQPTKRGWRADGFGRRVARDVPSVLAEGVRIAFAFCAPGAEIALTERGVRIDGAELQP